LQNYFGEDSEPFSSVSTDEFVAVKAAFTLIIDPKTEKVVSAQVDEIEGTGGFFGLNPHPRRNEAAIE
jgi:hypothetical protein